MTNDADAILDDLLSRWQWWKRPLQPVAGYAHCAAGCSSYRTSRQYDDTNGAGETDLEDSKMKAVNAVIVELPQPYRAAIDAEGYRLRNGVDKFFSVLLPDGEARRALIQTARGMLVRRLTSAGVM